MASTNPLTQDSMISTPPLNKRYQLASVEVLKAYPPWKKQAVLDDLKNHIDNTYTQGYAQDVINLAEDESVVLAE